MGFRYRKSINLGGGFRINLSKSGIGYSWGTKGARYTHSANGRERCTLSLPGTGLSYVQEGTKRKRKKQPSRRQARVARSIRKKIYEGDNTKDEPVTQDFDVASYQGEEYAPFFRAIRQRRKIIMMSNFLMVFFFFGGLISPLLFSGFIAGCCLKIYSKTKGKVKMEYVFDDDMEEQYHTLSHLWLALNTNKKLTKVTGSVKNGTRRTHKTGAHREVTEMPIQAIHYCPPFLSTNITPFGLKIDKQYVLFLPDKLLMVDGPKIGVVSYMTLTMETGVFTCLETGKVPSDTKIVARKFEHCNKDGSQDLRYKENIQLPVCAYGHIVLSSLEGLHIELIASNASTVENFSKAVEESSVLNLHLVHS